MCVYHINMFLCALYNNRRAFLIRCKSFSEILSQPERSNFVLLKETLHFFLEIRLRLRFVKTISQADVYHPLAFEQI